MIKYLDEVFTIPYDSACLYKKEIYSNITFGSRYMNQACVLENKELVDFLYSKGCSFCNVDLRYSVNEESLEFIEFLFQRRSDCSTEMNPPLLYYIIKLGTLEQVKELASIEGACNDEIIAEHKLLYQATVRGDPKICEFLMSFIPDHFSNDVYDEIEKSLINAVIYCPPTKIKINKYMEIDFNYYINYDDTYISFAAYKKNFKLLEIFEEHGADLSKCPLNFKNMYRPSFISVFKFFESRGNKFKTCTNDSKFPLEQIIDDLAYIPYYSPDTILYILNYSTPDQIRTVSKGDHNLIDILMNCNCVTGIIKAYKLAKMIFYPRHNRNNFDNWVKATNNQELNDMIAEGNNFSFRESSDDDTTDNSDFTSVFRYESELSDLENTDDDSE